MPGVCQVEALAELAKVMFQLEGSEPGVLLVFDGFSGTKWKKPVVPGDILVM